jgi:hypothetical protein
VLPSGAVSPEGASPAGTVEVAGTNGVSANLSEQERNQVSADGTQLFFVSPAETAAPQLYVQKGAAPGRLVSRDETGDEAPDGITQLSAGGAQASLAGFAYATPDGSRVLFRSESALTDDAPAGGIKTYRAEITPSSIELEYLPAVNGYPMAITDDASTILFSTAGSDTGYDSYYLWDEARLGGVPYTIGTELFTGAGKPVFEPRLSENGNVLVFASDQELEPGMTALPELSYTQIYRWTEQSEALTCISCRRDGGTPARFGSRMSSLNGLLTDNPAFPDGAFADSFNQSTVVGNRKISRDGSRVFFDTSDPLDPVRDVNGTRDVYAWEDDKAHLLTSGRGVYPSMIIDSSESGDDLLMVTMDGLIPSDTNETYDVYDVRVNGGFDESVEAGCEGDACQAPAAAGPAAKSPGSLGFAGSGNQHQVHLGQVRAAQIGKLAGTARLRINVPAAGRVKVSGGLVKHKARRAKSKGSVVVKVELTAAGKRKLARKGQLSTRVTVSFRDGDGRVKKKNTTLRFKQGGSR